MDPGAPDGEITPAGPSMHARPTIGPEPLLAGALLCLLTGQVLFARSPPATAGPAILAGAGLQVLGGALAWLSLRGDGCADVRLQPSRRLQLVAVALVAVLAGVLRLLLLDAVPSRIDGDAAGFARAAEDFLHPGHPPLIGLGWQGHSNVYFFLE